MDADSAGYPVGLTIEGIPGQMTGEDGLAYAPIQGLLRLNHSLASMEDARPKPYPGRAGLLYYFLPVAGCKSDPVFEYIASRCKVCARLENESSGMPK